MKAAVAGLIGVGVVLFLLSAVWSTLFPPTARWTDEKAARSHELKAKILNLSFIVNAPKPSLQKGQDLGQLKAEFEALKKESEQLKEDYASAAETPKTVATYMKWAGIAIALVGIAGYYAVNQSG